MSGTNRLRLEVLLRDQANQGSPLFDNRQLSLTTLDESFVVGEQGGDTSNTLVGSMSGFLLAGHTYLVAYNFDNINQLQGSSADGFFGFEVEVGVPIPAPGAALLAIIGLPLIGWVKRRFA